MSFVLTDTGSLHRVAGEAHGAKWGSQVSGNGVHMLAPVVY